MPALVTIGKYTIHQGEKSRYIINGKDRASLIPSATIEKAQKMTEEDCQKVVKKFLAWRKSKK